MAPPRVRLELLLQPRGVDGLPQGLPRKLFESDLPLRTSSSGMITTGHVTLPYRLSAGLLQSCHWRVTPVTLNPADSVSP